MKRKIRILRVLIALLLLMISLIILAFSYYLYQLAPVSKDGTIKKIQVEKKSSGYEIALLLKENNLIKDVNFFRLYLKLNKINNLKHGVYDLSENMGTKKIVDILVKGTTLTGDEIDILFREGINMRKIASVIENNTNNTSEDVFNLLKDEVYINELINEYWFLTEDIKNKDIYYPLEGYLAPDTYRFANEDVSVKQIFNTMLNQMDKILSKYKDKIEKSSFTIHEFITFASLVESEGVNDDDRPKIAGVFYNRLKDNWSLGSCSTACYAAKMDTCKPKEVPVTLDSPYNTYLSNMAGKLPVGPVSIPGEASIIATINPVDHNYYYFVSDKYKRTYFDKTLDERDKTIAELKTAGLWIEE